MKESLACFLNYLKIFSPKSQGIDLNYFITIETGDFCERRIQKKPKGTLRDLYRLGHATIKPARTTAVHSLNQILCPSNIQPNTQLKLLLSVSGIYYTYTSFSLKIRNQIINLYKKGKNKKTVTVKETKNDVKFQNESKYGIT